MPKYRVRLTCEALELWVEVEAADRGAAITAAAGRVQTAEIDWHAPALQAATGGEAG